MQALWMLFASFAFSIMGVAVKLASAQYSTAEIVMYRGLIGVILLFTLSRIQGNSLRTQYPWQHAWRGLVGVVSLWMWFYAISQLPLATAMTLNYMSPIWIAAILFGRAWLRAERRFEWGLVLAIFASSLGVVLLLQPSFHAEQWQGGLIALTSSVLAALAYLEVKRLGQLGEPEYRVVFYFSCSGMLAGLGGSLLSNPQGLWHAHSLHGIGLLLAVGVCATAAQMAMTRAYRLGNTLLTANLQYTGIVFSSAWGILIWNDVFGWVSWLGMAIILGSGLAATYYNTRSTQGSARDKASPPDSPIASEL